MTYYHTLVTELSDLKDARVCRISVGDSLVFVVVAGLSIESVRIHSTKGAESDPPQLLETIEPLDTRTITINCLRSGPLTVDFLNAQEDVVGQLKYLVHAQLLRKIEDLSIVSVITQRLGTLNQWAKTMRILARQNFKAVHFTPVQTLGESKSSYSVANFLELSPAFESSWDALAETVDREILGNFGMLSFCDIVLNHIASSSPWLTKNPQAGFNEVNTPWLKGAIDLDNLLKRFTEDLVIGKVRNCHGQQISTHVRNSHDVDQLVQVFAREYLNSPHYGFSHRQWYSLDVGKSIEAYNRYKAGNTAFDKSTIPAPDVPLSEIVDGASNFTEAVRRLVGELPNFTVRGDVLAHYAHSERNARDLLAWAQQTMWEESSTAYTSTLDAMRGTLTYERLEQKKGPITYEPWNSVVPWYFTSVIADEKVSDPRYEVGHTYALANNGWVMGWNSHRGFVERGGHVYLKRSLVAWSDCVKLRYGEPRNEKQEDCPELWQLMEAYAIISAKTFHGFRLDNCHTTPLPVARFVLDAARGVRPNLFVFAELFTGSEQADILFEETLGIDALVREAIQTSSPGDEAYHALKYSTNGCQFATLSPDLTLGRNFLNSSRRPMPGRSVNIFYDCTHDNETCVQKNRASDVLASAGIVSASGCAVGSTFGYEVLVKKNPTVLADGKLYPSADYLLKAAPAAETADAVEEEDDLPVGEPGQTTVITYRADTPDVQSVWLWGSHNGWSTGKVMSRSRHGVWYTVMETSRLSLGKFVIDGRWECSSQYERTRDSSGNENNLLLKSVAPSSPNHRSSVDAVELGASSGIIEARRLLNQIHAELGAYPEIAINHLHDDLVCISRMNPVDGSAFHFVIRSGWWIGNPKPGRESFSVMGKPVGGGPLLCARMASDRYNHSDDWALGRGHPLIAELDPPCRLWYDGNVDETWINLPSNFPSGSVCVIKTLVVRPDAQVECLINAFCEENVTLDLVEVNALLWSCDQEERDRSQGRRGVYIFPELPNVEYAGVMGIIDGMRATRQRFPQDYQHHGVYKNVQEGNWLMDYHATRVSELFGADHALTRLVNRAQELICSAKRPQCKARAIERLFSFLHDLCMQSVLVRRTIEIRDPIVQSLMLASTQMIGKVNSACMNEWTPVSVSAGLPFFTTEYMREWGRDTMLSLFGLAAPLGRWDLMKKSILCYARVIRHGLTPNLLDSSNNPRYNARDAVHFWLNAVQRYVNFAPTGAELLEEPVYIKFHHGLGYDVPILHHACQCDSRSPSHEYCVPLKDCVRYVLHAHYNGIAYREWNAGTKIDSQMKDAGFNISIVRDEATGFCLGGNRHNCGTWMDKMGSSEKAGNKGVPATPRDGAPVELTLALYSTLCWVTREKGIGLNDEEQTKYSRWRDQIKENFGPKYLITEEDSRRFPRVAVAGALRDVYGGSIEEEDFHLRCNYSVGLGLCLHSDILPRATALRALEIAQARLVNDKRQVGMKTLCAQNPRYVPNYDNRDDSHHFNTAHGFSYHQGPEWVWPYGFWFEAASRFIGDSETPEVAEIAKRLTARMQLSMKAIADRLWSGPWYSLPEITHVNGEVCPDGCQAQAWSVAGFLSYIWLTQGQLSSESSCESLSCLPRGATYLEDAAPASGRSLNTRITLLKVKKTDLGGPGEETKRSADGRSDQYLDCSPLNDTPQSISPVTALPRAADLILTDDEKAGGSPFLDLHTVQTSELAL